MATLSFNKFLVEQHDEVNNAYVRCIICGATDKVWHRLDSIVDWAEQHDCPVEFKAPVR